MEGITMDKEILINQFNDTQNRIKILDKQHKLNILFIYIYASRPIKVARKINI